MTFYVTTAIPYVNAPPHLGHALELVQADVLARHRRGRGEPVRFLTGTDDNALKNVAAARAAGVEVGAFVRANADRFAALRQPLELSFDDFIRTGSDPRHAPGVTALWRRSAPDFYRRGYTGLYCAGCEQFLDGDGCGEHPAAPERVAETNWFFRLSRYERRILDVLESGQVRVEPAARRNEVLAFVRAGLRDISVSRPAARADGWGIPVPDDPDQVVYVWWDALANYVTALGDGADLRTWWLDSAERVHVIGKGIVRFHAVYWLALLLSAGLPLPTTILVHDYLTVNGVKLAKSAGNAVDPHALADRYGVDALRWWLLSEVAPVGDTDFTVERLVARADRDLANGFGNLVNRALTLAHRHGSGPAAAVPSKLPERIDAALRTGDFRAAAAALAAEADRGNRLIEAAQPWKLADPAPVLAEVLGVCRVLADELRPFLPSGAARLNAQLLSGEPPRPVFPRLGAAAPRVRPGR
jgi:methionyl-tRNA synthetase